MISVSHFIKFQWDQGNIDKNINKHKINNTQAEEVFFNHPIILIEDDKHSQKEKRFMLLGKTDKNKLLTIIFTQRGSQIRIISARPMSKKERKFYNEK
jgi:uncharacterized protein